MRNSAAALLLVYPALVAAQGLTVHEWGTFTSVASEDGKAIDWNALAGENDLPPFVNDGGYRCTKWTLTGTVRMETPVIYFYSQREMTATVNVLFPHGVITEWYPKAENTIYESKTLMDQMGRSMQTPLYSVDAVLQTASLLKSSSRDLGDYMVKLGASRNGIDTSLRRLMSGIAWNDIQLKPGSEGQYPIGKNPSRYYAARGTDATPIVAGDQSEKFLFYRGVGRFAIPLSARLTADGKVVIGNSGTDAVPSVFLFENRGGRIGYRRVGAVPEGETLMMERPSLDSSLSELLANVEDDLAAQGLFRKEAHAMVETWRDSWFEEGARLIYLLPSGAVDAALPLQIEPSPEKTVRVFVGRIELVTAETKRSVEEAVQRGDRPAGAFDRFLDPILKRIYGSNSWKIGQVESRVWGSCRPFQ